MSADLVVNELTVTYGKATAVERAMVDAGQRSPRWVGLNGGG